MQVHLGKFFNLVYFFSYQQFYSFIKSEPVTVQVVEGVTTIQNFVLDRAVNSNQGNVNWYWNQ